MQKSINRDNTWFVELDKTSELFDTIHIIIHRKNPLRLSKLFETLKRIRKKRMHTIKILTKVRIECITIVRQLDRRFTRF